MGDSTINMSISRRRILEIFFLVVLSCCWNSPICVAGFRPSNHPRLFIASTTRRQAKYQRFRESNDAGQPIMFDGEKTSTKDNPSTRTRTTSQQMSKDFSKDLSHQSKLVFTSAIAIVFSLNIFLFGPFAAIASEPATAIPPPPPATAEKSLLLSPATPLPQQQQKESVIEEVWNLIDKYYIDRTFNNQDWKQVKQKASKEISKSTNQNDEKEMKVVTEMVQSLNDKYTRILSKEQYAAIQKFDLIGVGVTLMPNSQKDIIVGAPPIVGSSSYKAGLQVGDFVTAVNGIPTRGRNAFDIIDQISEQPNANTVTFSILRKEQSTNTLDTIGDVDSATSFDVMLDRQTMQVQDPIQYKITERRKDGTNVGYIRITEFNSLVNPSLQKALNELKKQNANAFVLDLRSNTGGAFQSAVEISGLFLKDKVATYVVDSNQAELPFRTPKLQDLVVDPDVPLVIWLDGLSASASEVLAGSLHDNCRAITMGDKSFGKGLIQAVYGLKNGAGLVLTVARYVTPSGNEIQGKGIIPDIAGNVPAPVFIPIFSTDTSKVDFQDIKQRLDPKVCHIPPDRAPVNGGNAVNAIMTTTKEDGDDVNASI